MDNYLIVLRDSLIKKNNILIAIIEKSEKQAEIVKAEQIDWDEFTKIVDEKGELIDEIMKLDDGFETLYARIKEGLEENKEKYKEIIKEIKVLVSSVTEKSANLEATERRNKAIIESAFANTRKEIKQSKLGQKAAADYYNKMNKINTIDPQLMDKNC
jgi:precorrin-4 methylase